MEGTELEVRFPRLFRIRASIYQEQVPLCDNHGTKQRAPMGVVGMRCGMPECTYTYIVDLNV